MVTLSFFVLFSVTVAASPSKEEPMLHIYGWAGFLPSSVVHKFEKETGIKVTIDYYDSNEMLEAKLLAQNSGYDVVFPTAWPYLMRQIQAHIYAPLQREKISNIKGVDPDFMKALAAADPGNKYALPFLWGVTGIAYNAKKVKELMPDVPLDTLALIFDERLVARFSSCGVELLDEAVDLFSTTLRYLGIDPSTHSPSDIQRAEERLRAIRPYIARFDATRSVSDLANGDACLILHWSNDIALAQHQARIAGKDVNISFLIPKEGTSLFMDTIAIPRDAPHPENAHAFINFLLRPDIIAEVTNITFSANAVTASLPFVKAAIRNNPIIYIPKQRVKTMNGNPSLSRAQERALVRSLTRIKSGR